jgi:hypothetical protein
MTTPQEALAAYFESKSEWRDIKAQEFPDDVRDVESSRVLTQLATYVLSLPDGDPLVEAVRGYMGIFDDVSSNGLEGGLEAPGYPASRIGFGSDPINLRHVLRTYVEVGLADQVRRLEKIGDPSLSSLRHIQLTFLRSLAEKR